MTEIGGYRTHPAADCFPMMKGEEFTALKRSIEDIGQLEPVLLDDEDRICDGRNRAQACLELGIDFDTEVFEGDIFAMVAARNLTRRHMEAGARAVAADKLALLPRGRPSADRADGLAGAANQELTQAEAADLMKVGPRSVGRVAAIRKAGRDDLYEKVGAGEMTPAAAERRMRKDEAIARIKDEPEPLPEGPFRVIVADPPWLYEKRQEDPSSRGLAGSHYPQMEFGSIADLDVPGLAHPDGCVLWLWTTNAHIFEAGKLCELWGFTPKTILTWDKVNMGTGDWLRGQTEHCVMAVKGSPTVALTNQTTILREKKTREHSQKPLSFYVMVDALCPGSKVELFARQPVKGWSTWGAEKEKFSESS